MKISIFGTLMGTPIRYVAYAEESACPLPRHWGRQPVKGSRVRARPDGSVACSPANVSELGWKKLRDARRRDLAIEILDLVFRSLDRLRVNVLLWDTHDSRHAPRARRHREPGPDALLDVHEDGGGPPRRLDAPPGRALGPQLGRAARRPELLERFDVSTQVLQRRRNWRLFLGPQLNNLPLKDG